MNIKRRVGFLAAGTAASICAGTARSQPADLQQLAACGALQEMAARLSCYEMAAGNLLRAVENKDIVVVEREKIRASKRALFGLPIPNIPFLNDGPEEAAEEKEYTATIAEVAPLRDAEWRIRLNTGAVWQTTEAGPIGREPKRGDQVIIRKGALGSYMMNIAGRRGLRAKRNS